MTSTSKFWNDIRMVIIANKKIKNWEEVTFN